jgi:polyferredoxin
MTRLNLLRVPGIKPILVSRWPQLMIRAVSLGGFIFAILTGLLGTPVGNRNFSIVVVWIAWWAALILLLVPLLGRGWCSICPIPMPGEWVQNKAVLGPDQPSSSQQTGRRWPKALRNIWLQNGAFTLLAVFSILILTRPSITAWLLLILLLVSVGVSLVYERRTFCRYLCPVGGFIGLYSQLSPLELRVEDTSICASHKEKSCYTGNTSGYGCPWGVFPAGMIKNTNCGLCMECLRTCEYDNIAINLRAFGEDLTQVRGRKLDEAFKTFIMIGSALAYSAVMLGPWGWLKNAAYQLGSMPWLGYVLGLLALIWILLPALFYLAIRIAQALDFSPQTFRQTFTAYAYSLAPLGLIFWIAFSLSFVFTNGSYLWPVLSDPFGWGWDLFGTASADWTPYLTQYIPVLQVVVLVAGLFWAARTVRKIASAHKAPRQAWPVVVFCALITVGMLWVLVA